MSEDIVSKRTAELLVLLSMDGVDREELKALVASAFADGVNYSVGQIGQGNDPEQR